MNKYFAEWEYLQTPLEVTNLKVISDDLDLSHSSISVARTDDYKIKLELHNNSNVPKGKNTPGQRAKVYTIEGNTNIFQKVRLEGIFTEHVDRISNMFAFYIELESIGEVEILTDWLLNAPKPHYFYFSRSTTRILDKKYKIIRHRWDEDSDLEEILPNVNTFSKSNLSDISESTYDYIKLELADITFMVYCVPLNIEPAWSNKIAIEYRTSWGGIPDESTRRCIREFIGFLLGKKLLHVGHTCFSANRSVVVAKLLNHIEEVKGQKREHLKPIELNNYQQPMCTESILNELLPKYIEMRDDYRLGEALWHYWNARTLPIGTDLSVLFIGLEALNKAWFASLSSKSSGSYLLKPEFKKLRKKILAVLETFSGNLSAKKQEDFKSVKNRIGNINQVSVKDSYRIFFEEIGLPVGDVEKEVFDKRNSATHADRKECTQEYIDEVFRISNASYVLFHRVFLKILGYEGQYIDFSMEGFPQKNISTTLGDA